MQFGIFLAEIESKKLLEMNPKTNKIVTTQLVINILSWKLSSLYSTQNRLSTHAKTSILMKIPN